MKLLIDENVSLAVAERLRALGHEVEVIVQSDLAGASDQKIFQVATDKKSILITRDHDLTNDLRINN